MHFIDELLPQELYIGEPSEWSLPDIVEGAFTLSDVIIEPDNEIKQTISYSKKSNLLEFDGLAEQSTAGNTYLIKVTLINSRGG